MPDPQAIKTSHQDKTLADWLAAPTGALAGVSEAQQRLLETLGVRTVFDLALAPTFRAAADLLAAAQDPRHPLSRHGLLPAGVVDAAPGAAAATPAELIGQSPERLAGIDRPLAQALQTAAGIATIRDMALWPPYIAARALAGQSLQADPEAQYTAPEIVPKFGEYATDIAYYERLVTVSGPDDVARNLDAPLDVLAVTAPAAAKPYLGARLTFQQSWTPEAITLGQVLHSLTLAPGESTRMAVIDWTRRSSTASTEDVSQSEALDNRLNQRSSLQEVTSSVAMEAQSGSSASFAASASQSAATAGAAWSPAAAGAAAAAASASVSLATSVAASAGRSDMASDYGQQIDRSTEQASLSTRSKRAALVTEASQSESETLSTRVVVNYNHMHTLNVLYFEVVQLYRVQLRLEKAERVLFVPMQLIKFDERVVERFRGILIGAALGPDVRDWLLNPSGNVSALLQPPVARQFAQIMAALDTQPAPRPLLVQRAKDSAKAQAEMAARFVRARQVPGGLSAHSSDLTQWDISADCKLLNVGWNTRSGRVEAAGVVPETGPTLELRSGIGLGATTVRPAAELGTGFNVADLAGITLKIKPADVPALQSVALYFITAAGRVFEVPCSVVLPAKQTTLQLFSFTSDPSLISLTQHLNENALHYSQHIWRRLDAQTLGLLLAPFKVLERRLLEYADTTPIAVAGRHLAFLFPDDNDPAWKDWLNKRLGKPYQSQRMVALPTGGVFAEGVLGRSNCAEKIDLTRFWNWQDSPPPMQASDIAALQAGQHTVENAQRPGGLEAPVVNIMNPPALPDPTGVSAVLSAMASGGMFRDMSGLAGTQALAGSALQASTALTGQSLSAVTGLVGAVAPLGQKGLPGGGAGGTGGGLAGAGGAGGSALPVAAALGPSPAASVARGLERAHSPLTANPTAIGGGLNQARALDQQFSAPAGQRANAGPVASGLLTNERRFFDSNFSAPGGAADAPPGSAAPPQQMGRFLPKEPFAEKSDTVEIRQGLPEALRAPTDTGIGVDRALAETPGDVSAAATARINAVFIGELQGLLEQALTSDDSLSRALRLTLDLQATHDVYVASGEPPLNRAAPALARAWRAALGRVMRDLTAGRLAELPRLVRLVAIAQAGLDRPLGLNDAETDLPSQLITAGFALQLQAQAQPAGVIGGQAVRVAGTVMLRHGTGAAQPAGGVRVKALALQTLEVNVETVTDATGNFSLNLTHDPLHLGADGNGPRTPDLDLTISLLALHPASDALQAERLLRVPGVVSSRLIGAVYDDDGSNALVGNAVITRANRPLRLSFITLSAGVPVRGAAVQATAVGNVRVLEASARTGDGDVRGQISVAVLASTGNASVSVVTTLADGRSATARVELQPA